MMPQAQPSVNLYLRLAQEAVEYVKGKVNAGSANRTEDHQSREKQKFQKLNAQYLNIQRQTQQFAIKDAKEPVKTPNGLQPPEIIDMHDEVCMEAFFAEFSGFGNCGEQAAVAYKYLSRLPIAGLVFIQLMGGNHEFVVLGAGPAVIEGAIFRMDKAKAQFGPHAVICDPWVGGGACFLVASEWDKAIAQMLKEAAPTADPAVVLVKCITRFTHQYRSTKVAAWTPPQ